MGDQANPTVGIRLGLLVALFVGLGALSPAAQPTGARTAPEQHILPPEQSITRQRQAPPAAPASSAETTRTVVVHAIADDDPGGGCTLREAIDQANFDLIVGVNGCTITESGSGTPVTYVIHLPAYTYTLSGAAWDDNNWSGDLDVWANVTFQGVSAEDTVIDGGDNDRVFHIDPSVAGGLTVTFADLTIRNGWVGANGGGIHDSGDNTLNIRDCTISRNEAVATAGASGGGVHSNDGVVNVTDTLISDNRAAAGPDAVARGGGISTTSGALTVTGSTIHNNMAYVSSGALSAAFGGGIYGTASTVNITDSAITDNSASGHSGGDYWAGGGGIYAYQSTLNVASGSTLSGNQAADDGGGIWSYGTPTVVSGSTISGNSAEDGGGIWNYGSPIAVSGGSIKKNTATIGGGIYALGSRLTITDKCSVYDNQAGDCGGGIYLDFGSEATVDSTSVSDNRADQDGGGIYVKDATLGVDNSTVDRNSATENNGGGICNDHGDVTLTDSTVAGNTAAAHGGGIYSSSHLPGGALALDGCTISSNTAGSGGGIFLSYSPATLTNTTISDNWATAYGGGGIKTHADWAQTLNLFHCTITANTAVSNGGGAWFEDIYTVNVSNTIAAGNSTAGSSPDIHGPINSQDYNLIQNPSGTTIGGTTTHNITGQDPRLGPLASNGGETQTHALLQGSPAIDAIPKASCPLSMDQRDVVRPQRSRCDIGAYEVEVVQTFLPLVLRNHD